MSEHSLPEGNAVSARPVAASERIEALDVLRGFALLGILLLNVLAMGLHGASYVVPEFSGPSLNPNFVVWATVDVGFEGAMRALFSMLFGAGVLLFARDGVAGRGALWFRRNFWLLMFGLVDAVVLLWYGDILIVYALVGAGLYFLRGWRPRGLLILAGILLAGMMTMAALVMLVLLLGKDAHQQMVVAPGEVPPEMQALAVGWTEFEKQLDATTNPEAIAQELQARRGDYRSVWAWNLAMLVESYASTVPYLGIWDTLLMMLIGMALLKLGILEGARSTAFYGWLLVVGFGGGLLINIWEVWSAAVAGFRMPDTFALLYVTYHPGRLLMALGWMALVLLVVRAGALAPVRRALAVTGQMALTNYLLQSVFAVVIFTGVGFGLVGVLERWQLYPLVVAMWAAQIALSIWWMARYRFGPCEWLWRSLTYWQIFPIRRSFIAAAP